ncbi:hypothetical protein ARMSODRAFT_983454 [Armillaria solidipes]|uniref:F-box domain-containing protein n=1 Tax=Armillaria solidipes TaxID=1076256 RepID=A0A2H3AVN6_9AGAR|nr:hypothetical protein ARMSODRAFT_983454 [Armillaria solidipes]
MSLRVAFELTMLDLLVRLTQSDPPPLPPKHRLLRSKVDIQAVNPYLLAPLPIESPWEETMALIYQALKLEIMRTRLCLCHSIKRGHSDNIVMSEANVIDDAEPQGLHSPLSKNSKEAVLTDTIEISTDKVPVKGEGDKNIIDGGGDGTELQNNGETAVLHEVDSFVGIMDAVAPLARVRDLLRNRDGEERVKTIKLVGQLSTKPVLLKHLLYIAFHPSKPNLHNLALADPSQFKFYQGRIANGSGAVQSFFLVGQVVYSELFNEDNSKQICVKPLYSHWARSAVVIGKIMGLKSNESVTFSSYHGGVSMTTYMKKSISTGDDSTLHPVPVNGKKHGPAMERKRLIVPVFDCKGTFQLTKYHKMLPVSEDPEVGSFVTVIFTTRRTIRLKKVTFPKPSDLYVNFGVTGHEVVVKKEIEVEDEPSEDDKDTPYIPSHILRTVTLCLREKMAFPLELYGEIASFADDHTVLRNFTLSCRAAQNMCQPLLWERVHVSNIHESGSMYLWFLENVHLARETRTVKLFGPGGYSQSQEADWLQLHRLVFLLSTGRSIVSVEVARFNLDSIPSSFLSPLLAAVIGDASFRVVGCKYGPTSFEQIVTSGVQRAAFGTWRNCAFISTEMNSAGYKKFSMNADKA